MIPRKLKKACTIGKRVLPDKDRKSLNTIYKDLKWIRDESPFRDIDGLGYYFEYLLYKKNAGNLRNYLPKTIIRKIHKEFLLGEGRYQPLLNKKEFGKIMQGANIPTTTYLGSVESGKLLRRSAGPSKNLKKMDLKDAKNIKPILSNWLKNGKSIFVKIIDSTQGKSIFKVSDPDTFFRIEFEMDAKYIVEEEVEQHLVLNKINPSCINTLRVHSLRWNNKIHIPGCFLRMGTSGANVDNFHAGGIFAPYDIGHNRLNKVAYKAYKDGAKSFYKHPDTNFEFKNQSLPYPGKIKDLVKKGAQEFPDKVLIGWDIAYTPNGPLIIEANDNPDLFGLQAASQGLLSKEIYREVFKPYYA